MRLGESVIQVQEAVGHSKDGLPTFKVVSIGNKVRGIEIGEYLTDTDLDDAKELGFTIKVIGVDMLSKRK